MTGFMGPRGVNLYRLIVARHAIKLEAEGLRMSRGRKWTTTLAREFGLPPRSKPEIVIAAIEKAIAFQKAGLKPGDVSE